MKPISLGTNPSEQTPPSEDRQVNYPSFVYRGPLDLDLPEHGEMTIHYCQTDERSASRPSGERYYECTIVVKKILDFKESDEDKKPARSYDEAGDALDKLMEAHEEENGNPGY